MKKYEPVLYNRIKSFSKQNRISFHMPVHGGGELFGAEFCEKMMKLDLTELDATDNLAAPTDVIKKTHENMAELFGADNAHILVGGSSAGIHAMLLSCVGRGDEVLVDRCAHISVINACVMYGIVPVFVDREIDGEYMIPRALDTVVLENAIKKHPHAKAVLVTSPTYYGVCSPIKEIAPLVQESGMALLVDAAHGSHFAFSKRLANVPTDDGADMCVLSLHKTLGAPTQTALLLHKSGSVDYDRVKMRLNMVHTTSPSYMLMCAADMVCSKMAQDGEKLVENMIEMTSLAKDEITKSTKCRCLCQSGGDISRLVINFSAYDITGYEVADILAQKYAIDVEMADFCNVVCITGPLTSENEICALANAVKAITDELGAAKGERYNINLAPIEVVKNPCEAFDAESELADVENTGGRICADVVSVYPPGVACLVPGAIIGKDALECIKRVYEMGGSVTGVNDGKIRVEK